MAEPKKQLPGAPKPQPAAEVPAAAPQSRYDLLLADSMKRHGKVAKDKNGVAKLPSVTLEEFTDGSEPLMGTIAGNGLMLNPKHFGTGSFGWHAGGRVTIAVGGMPVVCQANVTLTVVHSGPPKDADD